MTVEDVFYNALGCALLSRLHGQCFQTGWGTSKFAKLLALQGAFAKVILDIADPAGFVLARVAGDEGEIISIGVAPNSQDRGFGAKLMCAAEARSRKMSAQKLFLEVAETNESAIHLYQSLGYEIVGRRKNYYVDRFVSKTDALIMRLLLT